MKLEFMFRLNKMKTQLITLSLLFLGLTAGAQQPYLSPGSLPG